MSACLNHDAPLDADGKCPVCERGSPFQGVRLNQQFRPVSVPADTIGSAIDALNAGIAMVNAASERMKAFGLSPQISVNGTDYGDKVNVYVQGDLVR